MSSIAVIPPPHVAQQPRPQYVAPYTGPRVNLYPASALAQGFGVKMVLYSEPGAGKTPLLLSAPAPVGCISEPGLLSIRKSNVPCALAFTHKEFCDFVAWAIGSQEARQFQTFFFDSISQSAEILVTDMLAKHSHGKKAYGEMEQGIMEQLNKLYYARGVNVVLIAKQSVVEVAGVDKFRPYFPGQALNIKVPHLFDEVLRLEVQQNGSKMIRTRASYNAVARDRSGNLQELEQPDLSALFAKILTN